MHDEFHDEWISAYLDGELGPDEAERVEARLAEDTRLCQTMEELRALSATLHLMPKHRLGNDFAAGVLKRAEREMLRSPESPKPTAPANAPARRFGSAHWRRRIFWAATTVAAAVALMIYYGEFPFAGSFAPDERIVAENAGTGGTGTGGAGTGGTIGPNPNAAAEASEHGRADRAPLANSRDTADDRRGHAEMDGSAAFSKPAAPETLGRNRQSVAPTGDESKPGDDFRRPADPSGDHLTPSDSGGGPRAARAPAGSRLPSSEAAGGPVADNDLRQIERRLGLHDPPFYIVTLEVSPQALATGEFEQVLAQSRIRLTDDVSERRSIDERVRSEEKSGGVSRFHGKARKDAVDRKQVENGSIEGAKTRGAESHEPGADRERPGGARAGGAKGDRIARASQRWRQYYVEASSLQVDVALAAIAERPDDFTIATVAPIADVAGPTDGVRSKLSETADALNMDSPATSRKQWMQPGADPSNKNSPPAGGDKSLHNSKKNEAARLAGEDRKELAADGSAAKSPVAPPEPGADGADDRPQLEMKRAPRSGTKGRSDSRESGDGAKSAVGADAPPELKSQNADVNADKNRDNVADKAVADKAVAGKAVADKAVAGKPSASPARASDKDQDKTNPRDPGELPRPKKAETNKRKVRGDRESDEPTAGAQANRDDFNDAKDKSKPEAGDGKDRNIARPDSPGQSSGDAGERPPALAAQTEEESAHRHGGGARRFANPPGTARRIRSVGDDNAYAQEPDVALGGIVPPAPDGRSLSKTRKHRAETEAVERSDSATDRIRVLFVLRAASPPPAPTRPTRSPAQPAPPSPASKQPNDR